jgi:hypothetical protein
MPKIEIEIGGDVSELEAKILKAKELLKELQTKLKEEKLLKVDTSETLAAIKIAKSEIVSLQAVSSKKIAVKIDVDAVIPADVVAKVEDIADTVEKTSKKVKKVIIQPTIEVDTKPLVEADKAVVNLKEKVAKPIPSPKIDLGDKIVNETEKAGKGLNKLGQQAEKTAISTNKLTKATGNGSNTLMQFSRIAQDAPFGIMGIGNNITATAESFGYLSKSSGGAGNALKAVASSLLGTGGILLAVSLVTSALTYMSQNGITVGDIFDKLSGKFDAVGNSMKKAFEEGAKSAFEERAGLLGLISVAQSDVVSRKARAKAVKDLQDKYPAYFGNLTKEEIMYGNLTKSVNEITKALISKAVAEKLATDAVQPTIDLYKANAQLVAQKGEQLKMEQALAAENKKNKDAGFAGASNASVNLKNSIANNNLAITETRSNIVDLTKVVDSYQKNINKFNQASSQLLIEPDPIKTISRPKLEAIEIKTKITTTAVIEDKQKEGRKVLKTIQDTLNIAESEFHPKDIKFYIPLKPEIPATFITDAQKKLFELEDNLTSIIENSLANTLGGIGSAIGEALATGGNVLQAAGGALLAGLSSFLSDMGTELIKYGTLAVIKGQLDISIGAGGPVAIAAGIAAIGVGIALKAAGSALGARAKKGQGANSGGGGVSTDTGNNSFRGSTSGGSSVSTSGGFQSVVFEISGNSLIGVLENSLQKNRRLGGNLAITS